MTQLSDCGRRIDIRSLKLMVSTSVTINTFSHIYQQGKGYIQSVVWFTSKLMRKIGQLGGW